MAMRERVFRKTLRPTRQPAKNLHAIATAVFLFEFKVTHNHLFKYHVVERKGSCLSVERNKALENQDLDIHDFLHYNPYSKL